ncbi:la-related protein 6-like [Palaemon carinicauda]|uniref:la-related protein 6-like n=1 Tax=Palaemon carinicauda TaxID=392227 RepID=UPI0035B57DA4
MSTTVAKPVTFWPLHRPILYPQRTAAVFKDIAVAESYRRSPVRRPGGGTTKVMSDADTVSSVNPCHTEKFSRKHSLTSSESDAGPQILVHTTSVEDEDDAEYPKKFEIPYLLGVSGFESVTSTDAGSDYTSEGGDSSHDVDSQSVTPELIASLVAQVEEYLSDEGLANDLFLLKHVKRHKDGYVSLKLLSGYKKVKKISREWRVLALALRNSTKLKVNEEGTKVKRIKPLPSSLLFEAPSSRALIAINVPPTQASMGSLATLFGLYGVVASIQVMRPKQGGGVHSDLQALLSKIPEIATTICAIIEYEDVWGAAKALRDLVKPPMKLHVLKRSRRSERDSGHSSRVSPVPSPTPKGRTPSRCENGVQPEELRSRLKGNRSRQRNHQRESSASDGEDGPNGRMSWRMGNRNESPQLSYRPQYRRPIGGSATTPNSPSVFRRAQQQFGILRSPLGPDGTRGFARRNSHDVTNITSLA